MRIRLALMALVVAIALSAGVLLTATAVPTAEALGSKGSPTCHWVYDCGHWIYVCGCD
ncbi:MAG: hypothetical protein U0822_13805 [Anaerolineae bacterium]